jgi:exosortase/archaeosortase family protein
MSVPPEPLAPDGSPAWLRFALLCFLLLLAALRFEPHLAPLRLATAVQTCSLLNLAGIAAKVHGDLIQLSGFAVRIVTECTSIYPCLLYGALVLARPSSWRRTLAGLFLGVAFITSANLLRISFITATGPLVSPLLFEIVHVYLGQVAMLVLVLASSMVWLRWSAGGSSPLPFLLMVMIVATILFIPWVLINRTYLALLDQIVVNIFSLFYPAYNLVTPRPLAIYNHSFSVPLFLALIIARDIDWSLRRFSATACGLCLIAAWHILFRCSHVVWTALDISEIVPLHQGIYLVGQFLLPFMLWLLIDGRSDGESLQP